MDGAGRKSRMAEPVDLLHGLAADILLSITDDDVENHGSSQPNN